MKITKFNSSDFMEWFEETFCIDNHYAANVATNALKYAKETLSEEQIPVFLASILPDVKEEETAKFLKTIISNLSNGYEWHHYEDGSGCISGPDGEHFFSYDRQSYANCGGIEYKRDKASSWNIWWDGFEDFRGYAEESIRRNERQETYNMIVDDYTNHDVEFSTAFLDFVTNMSMLDAVEMYSDLQFSLNNDHVFLVKDAVIEGNRITKGIICSFETVFAVEDLIPEKSLTEVLKLAEEKAKAEGKLLIRADWVEVNVIPDGDSKIVDGEIMDFLF